MKQMTRIKTKIKSVLICVISVICGYHPISLGNAIPFTQCNRDSRFLIKPADLIL